MNYETANKIYRQIAKSNLTDLKEDLFASAIRYARIRVDWHMAEIDKRREMDNNRTSSHNAFIDNCNILSRNMAKAGEDNSWRQLLGDDRKEIGDFACHLHSILGINAR